MKNKIIKNKEKNKTKALSNVDRLAGGCIWQAVRQATMISAADAYSQFSFSVCMVTVVMAGCLCTVL
jgi:hypothetical protein